MGKYEPLTKFLDAKPRDQWAAKFAEIEEVLSFKLPPSARKHRAWWSNATKGNQSQSKGWIDAGWFVSAVDIPNETVWFARGRDAGATEVTTDLQGLWEKAREMSGIEDAEALERRLLEDFIQRQALKRLIALGGTMPDFKLPPRRRFPA